MRRAEALLTAIVGGLLVLMGIVLFASPQISYATRERIAGTSLRVRREKIVIVPRPAAAGVVIAGAAVLVLAGRRARQ